MPFRIKLARSLAVASALALAPLSGGCARGVAHPVDPDRALTALKAALDAWKDGKTPESLATASPPMVVQDLEWASGAKLLAYQVDGPGNPADANLDVRVRLTVAGRGKKAERDVRYLVTTSPAVTVFRDMMR